MNVLFYGASTLISPHKRTINSFQCGFCLFIDLTSCSESKEKKIILLPAMEYMYVHNLRICDSQQKMYSNI